MQDSSSEALKVDRIYRAVEELRGQECRVKKETGGTSQVSGTFWVNTIRVHPFIPTHLN